MKKEHPHFGSTSEFRVPEYYGGTCELSLANRKLKKTREVKGKKRLADSVFLLPKTFTSDFPLKVHSFCKVDDIESPSSVVSINCDSWGTLLPDGKFPCCTGKYFFRLSGILPSR